MSHPDDWERIVARPSGLTSPPEDPPVDDTEEWDRRRELEDRLRRTGVDPIARLWEDEPPQDQLRLDS